MSLRYGTDKLKICERNSANIIDALIIQKPPQCLMPAWSRRSRRVQVSIREVEVGKYDLVTPLWQSVAYNYDSPDPVKSWPRSQLYCNSCLAARWSIVLNEAERTDDVVNTLKSDFYFRWNWLRRTVYRVLFSVDIFQIYFPTHNCFRTFRSL